MKKFKIELKGVGTEKVGYAGPSFAPFRCSACAWFDWGHGKVKTHCEHPEVMSDSEIPHDSEGRALVDQSGCCNRFRPTKKLDEVKFEEVGL